MSLRTSFASFLWILALGAHTVSFKSLNNRKTLRLIIICSRRLDEGSKAFGLSFVAMRLAITLHSRPSLNFREQALEIAAVVRLNSSALGSSNPNERRICSLSLHQVTIKSASSLILVMRQKLAVSRRITAESISSTASGGNPSRLSGLGLESALGNASRILFGQSSMSIPRRVSIFTTLDLKSLISPLGVVVVVVVEVVVVVVVVVVEVVEVVVEVVVDVVVVVVVVEVVVVVVMVVVVVVVDLVKSIDVAFVTIEVTVGLSPSFGKES